MNALENLVSDNGSDAVTIDDALRLQFGTHGDSGKDTLIGNLLADARDWAERIAQRTLREDVTRQIALDCFARRIYLPHPPVSAITTVTYYDTDGNSQTVTSSNYRLQQNTNGACYVEFDDSYPFPTTDVRDNAVTVRYETGYGSDSVPLSAQQAIKLKALELYGHDDDNTLKYYDTRARSLLSPHVMPRYA